MKPNLDDAGKTKEQLVVELQELRKHAARLERLEAENFQAQRSLKESQERFAAFMDNSPAVAWMKDSQGRHVFINRKFEEVFRISKNQLLGKKDSEIFPKESVDEFRANDERVLSSGIMIETEEHAPTPDGVMRQWRVFKFPFQDANRQMFVGGMAMDITERNHTERRLVQHARQQAAVAALGLFALGGMKLQRMMDEAMHLLTKTLEVEFAKVLELSPEKDQLLLKAGIGWREGLVGHAVVDAGPNSQAGHTLLSNEPVVVQDLRAESRFHGPAVLLEHGIVSGMSTIIRTQSGPYGVLGVHATQVRYFTTDDVNFLQSVANLLAEAIDRNRAEKALNSKISDLQRINKIMMDREVRIVELKREVNTILLEAGKAPRYEV